jgi:hypothetical protein
MLLLGSSVGMRVAVLIHVNQIWSLQNLCVAVDDGWNDVLTVKSDKPLMKLILGAGGQNIELQNLHPSVRWKQLVSQLSLHFVNLWTQIIII